MNWSNEQKTPRDFEAKLETFLDGYAARIILIGQAFSTPQRLRLAG